jgi:hypothetical protein
VQNNCICHVSNLTNATFIDLIYRSSVAYLVVRLTHGCWRLAGRALFYPLPFAWWAHPPHLFCMQENKFDSVKLDACSQFRNTRSPPPVACVFCLGLNQSLTLR